MVEVHAEEAAFLWLLRDTAVHAPHYRLKNLQDLDERIEGHLDGVRLAGPRGMTIAKDVLELTDAGEVFTYTASAVAIGDDAATRAVLDIALPAPELRRGLVSALAWLPWRIAQKQVASMMRSDEPLTKSVATLTLALRRVDPGRALGDALEQDDEVLRIAAIRAVGLLGRGDLLDRIKRAPSERSLGIGCATAWSGSVLGDKLCTSQLYELASEDNELPWREELLRLVFRRFRDEGVSRVRELSSRRKMPRDVVVAAGALGDPAVVPWLIEQMTDTELARVAGEAFADITGAHFEIDQLWRDPPQPAAADPHKNPVAQSEELAEDEDAPAEPESEAGSPLDRDLYWPDVDKVTHWWRHNKTRFQKGVRYLRGRTLTKENLRETLQNGYQRQRSAAALELAALDPEQFVEVRAPNYRQRPG